MIARRIQSGGARLHVEAVGDARNPCVILVMGAQASLMWWPAGFCEALAALGRYPEARMAAVRLMAQLPATSRDIDMVERPAALDGYRAFLAWRAHHFLRPDAPWFQKAQVLADAGQTRSALSALEQSVANREPMAIKIASTPAFEGMRGDLRFKALVSAVGA